MVLFDPQIGPGATTPGQNRPWSDGNEGVLFPKLQHYWSLRLFSVISRALVGEVLTLCRDAVGVFYSPNILLDKNF